MKAAATANATSWLFASTTIAVSETPLKPTPSFLSIQSLVKP
jgi:hypothetical protein